MSGLNPPADAPSGTGLTLVFSDIEGSTPMWEADAATMSRAIDLHDGLLRESLSAHGGYEMRTEGDAFKVAFATTHAAVAWACDVQRRLLDAAWDDELLALPRAGEIRGPDGGLLHRGLRVRMGIHRGDAEAKVHPTTGRIDYYGPMVNSTARIAGAGSGGQVVISGQALDALPPATRAGLQVRDLGEHLLRGMSHRWRLHQVAPTELGRHFAAGARTPW